MPVSLKHTFQSAKTDSPDATIVQPSNWNAEHELTLGTNKVLGRATAGTGAAEELSVGAALSVSGGTLAVTNVPVANGGTGATTLTGYVKGNGTSAMTASASVPVGDLSGTLPVASGGTGSTTLAANNVLLGNGTSALQVVAPGASGNQLTSNGTTWVSQAPVSAPAKTWSAYTTTSTYTVPAGVFSIRVYAFGAGGDAVAEYDGGTGFYYLASGAGGGCAFGDIAVTPGQTVTITITSGNSTVSYAAVTRFTANKGANATTPFSSPNAAAGGTASIGTGVTNGNAYSGGNGSAGGSINQGISGGSSGSPLGVGAASSGYGGRGWGSGNGGVPPTSYRGLGPSGGAGGAATSERPGNGRGGYLLYTDPLLESLTAPGVQGTLDSGTQVVYGATGGPGAGGGGAGNASNGSFTLYGGNGGFGGGGGGCFSGGISAISISTGAGGFGASAGGGFSGGTSGPTVAGASGFGAGASTATTAGAFNTYSLGTAGAAIVLIYA